MFGKLGAPELLLILAVVILIFGAKRLPDMARSLGQSMRILKSETKALRDREDDTPAGAASPSHPEIASDTAPDRIRSAMPDGQRATASATTHDTFGPR